VKQVVSGRAGLNMQEHLKFIEEHKLIAVIRASDHGDAESIAKTLLDSGVRLIEVTPNVTQSTRLIETLSKQRDCLIGLGSATDGEQVFRAINSGARFVSSLYLDKNILTVCKNNDAVVIQGASTLTEAIEAHNFGVDFVRIFPVNFLGGPAFVKCLKRSYPALKMIPSGGITCANVTEYLKVGATACVVGRALCDTGLIRSHQWGEIKERAKQMIVKLEPAKVAR
jgi:2-dehydro-3-deoxyphosphogluconate aldolase / (4S)-4-hydroxy-2-oxoglutarate aldolase